LHALFNIWHSFVGFNVFCLLIILVLLNISTAVWYVSGLTDTQNSREDLVDLLSSDLNISTEQNELINFE